MHYQHQAANKYFWNYFAICVNKLHTCTHPNGVGSMLYTKINVNLGTEAIMDLSSHNKLG